MKLRTKRTMYEALIGMFGIFGFGLAVGFSIGLQI